MDVSYSYDDGFGDRVQNSACELYVYAPAKRSNVTNYETWEDCRFGINIYRNYLRDNTQ